MASSVPNIQKRSRTTAEQLSRMVDFLTETPGLAGSRFQKLHGKSDCDKKWTDLASMLNSLGGSVKNIDQWRTVWRDLKSRASIKVRDRKRKQAMTGNNPINEEPPTELERRVIALVGSDYVQGHETVAESVPVEEAQKTFLEIAQTQANALKMLAESSAANVQIASRQADALKLLAETSTASVQVAKSLAEAMSTMGEGLKASADAFNNLPNAIYRM
ncbi:PREDICTED: uncharacterized protein LOC108374036 isoform X2 [Rhagoletis zephyria]|uniref:uncharacterized protein LOC108374036 isoform X2 n=1 Tax=Rhagoletis zephyria TaxID=28612 RepID=UPI000811A3D4|nr:PREDICTED: uncharacterized protein LOC108374036 isoform X2 [Rhagoletis zephyria]